MSETSQMEQNQLAQNFNGISLLKFALPSIIMMIFAGLYTIGDTIFVARFVNADALSSINIVCPIINLIVGIGTMLAAGGSAIVAKRMGEGDDERARKDFTFIILVGAIVGAIITAIVILFLDNIITLLGASPVLFGYCKDYLVVLILFTPASMLQVLFSNLMVTAGKPGFGMVLSFISGGVNIVLDFIFIVVCDFGIAGAALGTGMGYLVPTVIGVIFFSRKKGTLWFCKPVWDFKVLGQGCLNGASEMVSQLATAITTFFFNLTMMRLKGESGVAAITIIIYSQFLLSSLYIGYSMGIAPIISYNYGSKNHDMMKKIYGMCLRFIGVVSITVFLGAFFLSSGLVRVFTPNERDVYELASRGFKIFSFCFLFSGINSFASASFTALSNGKVSAIIAFLRTFGFIMLSLLILPIFLNVTGVWLAIPIAEGLTFIVSIYFIVNCKVKFHTYNKL